MQTGTLEERAVAYVRDLFRDNAGGHDADHTLRVWTNAKKIAGQEPPCDRTVLMLAALLHDADDHKLFRTVDNRNARIFMLENGIPEAQIEAVCNAVNSVSFSQNKGKTPETPEGRIVQDADRLDAIGAVGIGRTFAFGGEHGRPLQDSIRHFYDKLLLLKDQMNTETAKRMAAERHAFLEAFLREWNAELNGEPAEDRGGYDGSELDRRL